MSTEGTPPPIPTEASAPVSAPVFPLRDVGKKNGGQWSLTVFPTHLALADAPGAKPYVILRDQMTKSVMFMEGIRVLTIQKAEKISLKLTAEGAKAVEDWIGKPFLAAFYMHRRYKMVLPWALMWVMLSLMSLVPQNGRASYFDWNAFVLGLV